MQGRRTGSRIWFPAGLQTKTSESGGNLWQAISQGGSIRLMQEIVDADRPDDDVPHEVVRAAARRQVWSRTIVSALALGIVTCGVLWFVTEPVYRGTATLQILEHRFAIAYPDDVNSSEAYARTQLELIRHSYLIGRAIEENKLTEQVPELARLEGKGDPVPWIEKRLNVTRKGNSELYDVTFDAEHPVSAERVVNAIVRTYLRIRDGAEDQRRLQVLQLLEKEKERARQDIVLKQRQLKDLIHHARNLDAAAGTFTLGLDWPDRYLQKTTGTDEPISISVGATAIEILQRRYADHVAEMLVQRSRLEALKTLAREPIHIADDAIELELREEPDVLRLTGDLATKRELLDGAAGGSPEAPRIQAEIDSTARTLERRTSELRSALREQALAKARLERDETLSIASAQYRIDAQIADHLDRLINEENAPSARERGDRSTDISLDIAFAQTEVERAQDLARRLANRVHVLKVEGNAPAQVKLIQEASVPEFPAGPAPSPLVVGGLLAFLAPFVFYLPWALIAVQQGESPA